RRARGGRGLAPAGAVGDGGGGGRAAEPVPRPARSDQRGADGGGPLAGRAGGGTSDACDRERRRPAGGVGGGRRVRRALGRGWPALAARRGGLSVVRGPYRVRRGGRVGLP